MLQDALDTAATRRRDRQRDGVRAPPDQRPGEPTASQLGDRTEVQLIEKLLTDFREASDKGAAMVGSHAQIVERPA